MKNFIFRSKYNKFILIGINTDKNTAMGFLQKDGQPVEITKSFDLRNDKLNRVTAAAIAFGGVTFVAKVNNKQEADTFINFNTAQYERKKAARAAKAAEAEAKRHKPFEYYLTADSAERCAAMTDAVHVREMRENGAEVVAYYQKQLFDARENLRRAEAAYENIKKLADRVALMSDKNYTELVADALEQQYSTTRKTAKNARRGSTTTAYRQYRSATALPQKRRKTH